MKKLTKAELTAILEQIAYSIVVTIEGRTYTINNIPDFIEVKINK